MSKYNQEVTETILDESTGELISFKQSKTFTTKITPDKFYFTFLMSISEITKITRLTDIKALSYLCSIAEYNTGIAFLPSARKKELCNTMNLKPQTVSNALTNLKKGGFVSGKGGAYTINPEYFWKGSLKERELLLKSKEVELDINFNLKVSK